MNTTTKGILGIMACITLLAFSGNSAFAMSVSNSSLKASPAQVYKGQSATLTATGVLTCYVVALPPDCTYEPKRFTIDVEFWEKDTLPTTNDYVGKCTTSVSFTPSYHSKSFSCSVTLIPSQYTGLVEGKQTEYIAKVKVFLGTKQKASGTTNQANIYCSNC